MIKGYGQPYNCAPNAGSALLLEYAVTKYAISQKHLTPGHWNKYMVLEYNVSQRIISYLVSNKNVIILCFKE